MEFVQEDRCCTGQPESHPGRCPATTVPARRIQTALNRSTPDLYTATIQWDGRKDINLVAIPIAFHRVRTNASGKPIGSCRAVIDHHSKPSARPWSLATVFATSIR